MAVARWRMASLYRLHATSHASLTATPERQRRGAARLPHCTNRDAPPPDDADGGVGRERVQAVHTHATVTHITVEQRSGRLSVTVCLRFRADSTLLPVKFAVCSAGHKLKVQSTRGEAQRSALEAAARAPARAPAPSSNPHHAPGCPMTASTALVRPAKRGRRGSARERI